MTDEPITDTQAPGARFFRDPENGGIQEVHNLGDDAPYLELGLVEITEAEYLAALETIDAEPDMPDLEAAD